MIIDRNADFYTQYCNVNKQFCSCMERFEATAEQDLFNRILEDPQYEINRNEGLHSFIEKLQTSQNLECCVCFNYIRKMLIFYKDQMHCLPCFCKDYQEGTPYLTVDLNRRLSEESKWSLFQEWQMVNSMSKLGVDNYQGILQRMEFKADEHLIQEYQKTFLQYKQNYVAIKDTPTTNKQLPHKDMYQKFINSLFSQYNVLDYMIANLHQKSQPKHVKMVLQYKRNQDKMTQKMRQEFKKLSQNYQKNILHPEQYEENDEEISISDMQLANNKEEEEFWKRTAKLLAETDDLIKKNMLVQQEKNKKSIKKKHSIKKYAKKQRQFSKQLSKKSLKTQVNA